MRVVLSAVTIGELKLPEGSESRTVSAVVLSSAEGSPQLGYAELAVQGSTGIANAVTVTLPSLDDGMQLQVTLSGAEDGEEPKPLCTCDLLALGVAAAGRSEGRVHNSPMQAAAGGGGAAPPEPAKGKKGAPPPAEAAPAADASLSCFWRVEPDFPDLSLQRCPPLAIRYFGAAYRDENRARQSLWREELQRDRNDAVERGLTLALGGDKDARPYADWQVAPNPGVGATRRYEMSAPLKPSYLIGDPTSRASRYGYVHDKTQLSIQLSAQTIQVQLNRLMEQLFASVTAEQASDVLNEMKRYLNKGANLMQIDAEDTLACLRRVSLPFERLVRNVWTEGPEVAYDRYKAGLQAMLEQELETRATEAAWAAGMRGGFGPKPLVPQLVHDMRVADPRVGAPKPAKPPVQRYLSPAATLQGEPAAGTRLGLASFKGKPPAPVPAHATGGLFGNSREESRQQSLLPSKAPSVYSMAPSKAASVAGRSRPMSEASAGR